MIKIVTVTVVFIALVALALYSAYQLGRRVERKNTLDSDEAKLVLRKLTDEDYLYDEIKEKLKLKL